MKGIADRSPHVLRTLWVTFLVSIAAGCDPVNTTDSASAVLVPVYGVETSRFGFEIAVPADLEELGWSARDPAFFSGRITDVVRGISLQRAYTLAIDSPGGGLQLANNAHEFVSFYRTTQLVLYVYDRPTGVTLDAMADSIGGVAYQTIESEVNGQASRGLLYRGSREDERPRTNEEVLIPRHILENTDFFYFVLYWPTGVPETDSGIERILNTFRLVSPS